MSFAKRATPLFFSSFLALSACSSGDGGEAGATDAFDDAAATDSATRDDATDVGATNDTRTEVGDGAIDARADTADAGCAPYVDDHATQREACTFVAGAHASATLGDGSAARAAIKHLVVLLHENRSLDHYFGLTGHGIEGIPPTFTNPDGAGGSVKPFHYSAACICDVPHDHTHIASEWDLGKMDGFVTTDGAGTLGYFTDADHPFYTWLMTTFATSDRYFCSALGDTGHNRHFLWHAAGTTGTPIFAALQTAKIDWANFYEGGAPLYNDLGGTPPAYASNLRHDPGLVQFYAALADPTGKSLPQLSIVDQGADEHPPGDVNRGEAATRQLVENIFASPSWSSIALVFTYDEGGGLFDHVPPPKACLASTVSTESVYDNLGIRVPMAIVSPFAKAGYVSHVTHSHTSITRLIELLYDLPALTPRDANSDALLDMFDFGCPGFTTPPKSTPAAGAMGCAATCVSK